MSDFNKIFITGDGGMQVSNEELAILFFNDGKVLSKTKYSLENHTLSILEDTTRTITIFYNNYFATTYEFTTTLKEDTTVLPTIDNELKYTKNLYKDRLLVFIDGVLQQPEAYDLLDSQTIILKVKRNDIIQHSVIVYSSAVNFERTITAREPGTTLDLDSIPCPNYSQYKTMVFLDGIKVDYNAIESFIDSTSGLKKDIKINNGDNLANFLEIIRFYNEDDKITSLNFETDQGYLSYGPYDDFGNKIPNMYNVVFEFQDQLKLLVDDIRPGFFIKEVNGSGEAIVLDETFEGTTLHCMLLQPFTKSYYTHSEYYFRVPEYTTIVKYLSEFDTKYTFLPEILNIFQRLLLDEIQDTIKRLRDSRSIQKADSTQINRLLQLLGCNLNTKRLTKKQRRELIEELNNFYRIAGTRNSYNILNILQNDLKLINIEQLFTPYEAVAQSKKKRVYQYLNNVVIFGSGYKLGDYLIVDAPEESSARGVLGKVVEINDNGGILEHGLELTQSSGYVTIHGNNLPLKAAIDDVLINIKSVPNQYTYNATINSNTHGYTAGQILHTIDNKFNLTINSVDGNGKIVNYTLSPTTGTVLENRTAVDLILETYSINVQIRSTKLTEDSVVILDKKYSQLENGNFNLNLEPGFYTVEISGAGGGGGSGDSNYGIQGDISGSDGYAGEKLIKEFTISSNTNISGKIGQGGGSVKTTDQQIWEEYPTKGNGYAAGKNGDGKIGELYVYEVRGNWYNRHIGKQKDYYSTGWWCVKGGQGGGSSSFTINNETYVAKGGNGGSAGNNQSAGNYYTTKNTSSTTFPKVNGGQGGSGGTTVGTGSKGGLGCTNNKTYESTSGQDGYIKITRYKTLYSANITGDLSSLNDGERFTIKTQYETFDGVIYTDDRGRKRMAITARTTGTDEGYIYTSTDTTINTELDNAKLTLTSTPSRYSYICALKNLSIDYLKIGDTFKTTSGQVFTATITNIDRTNNSYIATFTPMSGTILEGDLDNPDGIDKPVEYQTGTGARMNINYVESESSSMNDLCYVDFRTKEELGAKPHKEFRRDKIDYGIITEGTPKSPRWWKVGDPDLDWGSINEETEKDQDKDYGYIKDNVKGEWVEWWEWNRSSEWYPTNHVITEIKMPTDIDFREFSDTFVEQFYKLASAVVYIHAITESFYFGTNVTTNTADAKSSALFGIAVGAPIMTYELSVTSNPAIQYLQPTPTNVTLTIIPTPADATVKLECPNYQTISGTGTQSMTVKYGEIITWTVQKSGYRKRSVVRSMFENATKRVVLERILLQ